MDKVEEDIIKSNILNEGLLSGFRFYLLKVSKTFLNEKFIQQFLKEQPESKLSKTIKNKIQSI